MSATIRDDTWNVLNIQHTTPNSKRWEYSDTPGGGHKKITGPAHMAEGGHHLRKAPNPFSFSLYKLHNKHQMGFGNNFGDKWLVYQGLTLLQQNHHRDLGHISIYGPSFYLWGSH